MFELSLGLNPQLIICETKRVTIRPGKNYTIKLEQKFLEIKKLAEF